MAISSTYRPGYSLLPPIRVDLDGWSAGSTPGAVDNQGTKWILDDDWLKGWQDAPPPRTSMEPRPGEHGAFDGPAFNDPRVLTVSGTAIAADFASAWRARDIVASVCGDPSLGLSTMVVTVAGAPTLRMQVRRSRETKTALLDGDRIVAWSMILTAPDPRRYSDTLTTSSIGLPVASGGGLVFPLVFPLAFGSGAAGGEMTLVNAGTTAAWPTWTILGPVTGPFITNATTGDTLTFDPTFVIGSGQTLVIDSDAKSVKLQGVNRRDALVTANWFQLEPGSTIIRFAGVGIPDPVALLTATYRDGFS